MAKVKRGFVFGTAYIIIGLLIILASYQWLVGGRPHMGRREKWTVGRKGIAKGQAIGGR